MSGTVLTNKGLALITKLVAASTELQISRVAVGTGRVPSGVDPQTMVDLNEYKMDAQIESYGVSPDQSDVAYIAAQVSSIGVSAGFAVTEAGVFATDPDVGEILYAYLDLTEDPQYIYAETDAISKFAEITFNVLIGSVAKVTAYVSPGALTKKVDFNAFKESVETPEFDDSGTVEGISSFPSFLETMKSKMNFFQFFRNLKAGLQFVLHAGQIVNNCVTDNAGLPLSAAQGKILKDLYTQLYSDKASKSDLGIGTEISDCNNPSRRIEELAKKSLNSPNSEGMTVAINGIILSANPTQSIWNGQMALTNGKFPSVFVRGSDGAGFSKWEALAKKSDLSAYATNAQLLSTFINISNKRYVKITANENNTNYGIIFAVTSQGILCVYSANGNFTTLFESTGNRVNISASGLVTTIDCAASFTHGFILRGGSLKNMPYAIL